MSAEGWIAIVAIVASVVLTGIGAAWVLSGRLSGVEAVLKHIDTSLTYGHERMSEHSERLDEHGQKLSTHEERLNSHREWIKKLEERRPRQ